MDWHIYENGVLVNTIHCSERFVRDYCARHGYTYELRPDVGQSENAHLEDLVARLVDSNNELREALDLLLSGVTE